ncbi:MAG: DegV family protein [Anaerolineae bacterium]|nr:DegV family protein [Anaerolineae bacterium]
MYVTQPTQSVQLFKPVETVAIITDSIAQVPPELANRLKIRVMPCSMTFEENVYEDLADVDLNDLYQRMRFEKDLRLVTSAPSVGKFYETFKECWDSGAESLLYVGLSSRLSSTFSCAQQAARMLCEELGPRPIFLYDSRMATAAQGFLVIEAVHLAQNGSPPQEIIERLNKERRRTGFVAGLETLEYLARGGRIGKAAYMLGNAIQILPVLSLDDKGEVVPVSRKRGYNQMMEEIIRYTKAKVGKYHHLSLAVMHANARKTAEKLQEMAISEFQPDEIYITDFTPTMVAHTGPGLIGLAYHWS